MVFTTKKCQKITGNIIPIRKMLKTSTYDIPYFVTNNRKISKVYKWKPSKSIDEIIKDIFIWLEKNKMILKYFK